MTITIKQIPLGPLETNSYLIFSQDSRETFIIDLGDYPSYHLKIIEELDLKLKFILFTHGHYDHIKGLEFLDNLKQEIPVYIGKNDLKAIGNFKVNLSYLLGEELEYPNIKPIPLKEGDILDFSNYKIKIWELPGHTPGSLGIELSNNLFAGDTIFKGTVGRTDLPGGNPFILKKSIQKVKNNLSPETIIWPGHGEKTTLKKELKLNPFF